MYSDGFGQIGSLPKDTKLTDLRSPDRCPSFSIIECGGRGHDLTEVIEVRDDQGVRLGAIVLRAIGDRETGKLSAGGVAVFSNRDILHATDDEMVQEIRHARNAEDDARVQKRNSPCWIKERPEGHEP